MGQHGGPIEDHILHSNHRTDYLKQNYARTQKKKLSLVPDGIYPLGKAHKQSTLSLRRFTSVAFKTVLMSVWLTMALSHPLNQNCRALPPSITPPGDYWCDVFGFVPASFSVLQTFRDTSRLWWLLYPSVCLLRHSLHSSMSRAVRPQQHLNLDVERYDTCQSAIPIALFTFCTKRPFVLLLTAYCEEGCCLLCCCLRLHSVCVVAYCRTHCVASPACSRIYIALPLCSRVFECWLIRRNDHPFHHRNTLSSSLSSSSSSMSSTPASVSCHHHHHYDACITFTKGAFPVASK